MSPEEKLSLELRNRLRHDLGTIVTVLKTAMSVLENGDEMRSELITMIEVPKERLNTLLELLASEQSISQ